MVNVIRTDEQQFNDLLEMMKLRGFVVEFREVTESVPHPDRDPTNPEHERLRLGWSYNECAVKSPNDPGTGAEIVMDEPDRALHELESYWREWY